MSHRSMLVALIACCLACVATPHTHAQAADAFEQAMLDGQYGRAMSIAQRLFDQQPTSSVAAYNMACACSRAGHLDDAIKWLGTSATLGFAGVRSIRDDEDLAAVRGHDGFAAVRDAVQANAAARFKAFKAAAQNAEPTVILPPGHDPQVAAPLLVILHGTGGTGAGVARAWKQAAQSIGAIIVAPDALRPVRGTNGYSWVFRDEAEWLVLKTIDESKKKWSIGPVILAGFSQGANIALMLGQSHPDRFDAVIPVCGHYETDVAELPTQGDRPRWALIVGERDPWAATYDRAKRDFKKAGMTVRHDVVRGIGHAIPSGERGVGLLKRVLTWAIETEDADTRS